MTTKTKSTLTSRERKNGNPKGWTRDDAQLDLFDNCNDYRGTVVAWLDAAAMLCHGGACVVRMKGVTLWGVDDVEPYRLGASVVSDMLRARARSYGETGRIQ